MMQIIKQRDYIQSFLDFVSSFLITEEVTIAEMDLVEANLDILKARITQARTCKAPLLLKPDINSNQHNS